MRGRPETRLPGRSMCWMSSSRVRNRNLGRKSGRITARKVCWVGSRCLSWFASWI